jgi:BMFP domain-containing protein YqiC
MLKPRQLDDLSQRLANSLPKGLQALQEDISRNLRASLEAGLGKLDLVTREEFDVQSTVLARTRAKLQTLEQQVAELQRRLGMGERHEGATAASAPRKNPS